MPDKHRNTRDKYNKSFLLALEQLNLQQRAAVDHIEGPVLVIAGPGTGKTHILTARIGRILMETDTQPHNILCLTFTDSAVRAMRERLLDFIGPEAHRVHIYTFHSFCNNIIQDNLELFGRHDLEPLSELERVEIFRRLLDELDLDHPLRGGRTDIYFYETHLYDLFKRMKQEDWTVDFMLQRIDDYLAELPNRPAFIYQRKTGRFQKGDLKEAKFAEEKRRMKQLRAAVKLYPRYLQAMRHARRYDYDDMILWVLRAFEEQEALLRSYQEQYLYFLVDEYQDTNGAQNEILQKLIDFWENPNVFIVGDDDQSIYEFQGARLKNLTEFYTAYRENLELIVLKENYRSSQLILDTSRLLIRHNEHRIVNNLQDLGVDKALKAAHSDFSESSIAPRILTFPNRMQEETFLVEYLAQLQAEGFPLEEVAFLYARHRQVRNIVKLLEKGGIPYNVKRKVNILHLPLIQNLRDILAYLLLESQRSHSGEHLLFRLLHFPFIGIAAADIARISTQLGQYDWQERPSWRSIIGQRAFLQSLSLDDAKAILAWSDLLESLLHDLHELPLPALLERVINRSGLLQYVLKHEERDWHIQVVKTFSDFVQRECERNPRLQLSGLLEHLQRMDANRLPIELNKEVHAAEGVNLVTVHSAKGLEFRYVFVIDCVKDDWEPRGRRGNYQFSLPDTLTYSGEEDALEARRRLFYVAMTRAKERLWLTYSRQSPTGKELQRAIFIDEITQAAGLEAEPREVPQEALLEAQILYLQESARPHLPEHSLGELDALLAGFTLTISALNSYLYCPLGFFYEHLLRVPVKESEASSYGTAAHQALQRLFERMLRSEEKEFPGKKQLVQLFEYEMESRRANFSTKEYERRLEMGRRYLAAYYERFHRQWPTQVRVEYTIRNVEVDGVPVTGTIDRLDLLDASRVRIVDYKTGTPRARRMRRLTEANPHGGTYRRQLIFYKLLFDNAENGSRQAAEAHISYLDPDKEGEFVETTLQYDAKEVRAIRNLIREVYAKILRREFTEGCGESRCPWCRFVRHNVAVDSFANPELEALDD